MSRKGNCTQSPDGISKCVHAVATKTFDYGLPLIYCDKLKSWEYPENIKECVYKDYVVTPGKLPSPLVVDKNYKSDVPEKIQTGWKCDSRTCGGKCVIMWKFKPKNYRCVWSSDNNEITWIAFYGDVIGYYDE